MTALALILYFLIGLIAGFMGGMLGIGGGLVTVPSLILIFSHLGFPPEHRAHLAIGTSLGAMVLTAAASAYAHFLKKGILWNYFRGLSPGIVLGALLSAIIAGRLSNNILEMVFGFSVCIIGLYFIFTNPEIRQGHLKNPHLFLLAPIGIVIGALSTLLGIGGGIVTVPILTAFGVPMRNAISTSAATGLLIAITGAISFIMVGVGQSTVEAALGYVYLPAFVIIGLSATLTAHLGAASAYILPTHILRHIFGIFLLITGVLMLF